MTIRYLGHSCFELKNGKTLIIDPYGKSIGRLPDGLMADVVLVTHQHDDHNFVEGVAGSVKIINQAGVFDVDEFKIIGTSSFHDDENGSKRGENVIFTIEVEGVRICHLGDLGQLLTNDQLSEIGEVDVLMIPVGGYYTIDATEATQVVKQIKPELVLPMHFKPKGSSLDLPIVDVDGFLNSLGWPTIIVDDLNINQNNLDQYREKIILFKN